MNDNTKLEIAVEIMSAKIAKLTREKSGIIDDELRTLMDERKKMYEFDKEIIDKIINVYGKDLYNE